MNRFMSKFTRLRGKKKHVSHADGKTHQNTLTYTPWLSVFIWSLCLAVERERLGPAEPYLEDSVNHRAVVSRYHHHLVAVRADTRHLQRRLCKEFLGVLRVCVHTVCVCVWVCVGSVRFVYLWTRSSAVICSTEVGWIDPKPHLSAMSPHQCANNHTHKHTLITHIFVT